MVATVKIKITDTIKNIIKGEIEDAAGDALDNSTPAPSAGEIVIKYSKYRVKY